MRTLVLLLVTALVTACVCVVAINLMAVERRLHRRPRALYALHDGGFRRAMGVLLGPAILPGNDILTLVNGDRIFPPMLAAIRAARASICFETFIFWSGDIGEQFTVALEDAARRGVRVHVLLDWLGARRRDPRLLARLSEAGVEVELYHRLSWFHIGRMNNRTHRKLLIVDGRTGFTGGAGIARQWLGDAADPAQWRDTHFQVRGPVVAQMQAVFLDNWIKVTGVLLDGEAYFPPLAAVGEMDAQMFCSSPSRGAESLQLMFLLAIAAARRSIDITSPYFLPDRLTIEALVAAARRGVIVRILVPGRHTDVPLLRRASRAGWGRLLNAGVAVFEYQPTMIHCKVVVVDGHWTTLGSANFDNRSFRLNDEANLNVFSDALAREQSRQFDVDLRSSHRISLRQWRRRSVAQRLQETLLRLLHSQL